MKLGRGVFLRTRISPVALLLALYLFFLLVKRSDFDRLIPGCPIKSVIGVDCPACGSSRCISALATGNFIEAADQNALLLLILTVTTVGLVMWAVMGEKFLKRLDFQRAMVALSVFTLVFWVIRLLPLGIGNWLSSGTYHQ
jgi:hypothetical protein